MSFNPTAALRAGEPLSNLKAPLLEARKALECPILGPLKYSNRDRGARLR